MDDFSHNVLSRNDIVRAAKAGRLDLVQQCCIGSSNDKVRAAICEAIQEGHTSVVEYLLNRIYYAGLEINDSDISESITNSIQNKNYKTIEIVSKSKLIDFVNFRDVMKTLVYQNFMDIVKRFWLNDERLETICDFSPVEVYTWKRGEGDRKVPLLSRLLEFAPNLEMVQLLTSSNRFNKDHCNFAALKAVYDRKYDIFQYLREYVDLRMFDDSFVYAAIEVNNVELVKYLVQGGCKVYVSSVYECDNKEEMCLYLLENGEAGGDDGFSLESGFIHRWYSSDEPGRLHTMKLILNHPSTNLVKLRNKLHERLEYMESDRIKDRTSFPEWDLVFEFMDPDYFISSMRHLENLFIYVWEKYPVLQTVENMNHLIYRCDSIKIVEMILRDNRFDLSKIPINLYDLIDLKRYDIFYVLCKDPRFVLTKELVQTGFYLCFHEDHLFRLREKRKDFQKLFLKKTQARDSRHQILWTEIDKEERESVEMGLHLFEHLNELPIEFTLKVMKYNEEVYRNSSIIGPDADVFAHYTRLLLKVKKDRTR